MAEAQDKLAIHGGRPAKTVPYTKGVRFGKAEEEAAVAAIRSQKLWFKQGGTRVAAVEKTICRMWGVPHAIACSSGSAAVHTALAICGVEAGDEVIVNPVTDWGSMCGILALGAVPVFADLRPDTFSLDPAAAEKAVTPRTGAILLVHLAGYPAHVREIVSLARAKGRNIKVVEDCAQSPMALLDGKPVGTFGDAGAFSTNDSKHVSCGEGGFVVMADEEMARTARLFIDKGYQAGATRGTTDVRFLGFNYRLSELSAAVLDVQLAGLEEQIRRRTAYAERVIAALKGVAGLRVVEPMPGSRCGYWFVLTRLELDKLNADRNTIAAALSAEGISVWGALAPARTLAQTTALREKRLYPQGRTAPAAQLAGRDYGPGQCPIAEQIADSVVSIMVSPFYSAQDADETAAGFRKVLSFYAR
jgi:dTDP-4-amino-4,6-dideoxygalactose transaminase